MLQASLVTQKSASQAMLTTPTALPALQRKQHNQSWQLYNFYIKRELKAPNKSDAIMNSVNNCVGLASETLSRATCKYGHVCV